MNNDRGKIVRKLVPNTEIRSPWALAELVASAAGVPESTLDEQYVTTAVMVERTSGDGTPQTLLVELLENLLCSDRQRWTVMAIDELRVVHVDSCGATAEEALAGIRWSVLDIA